MLHTHIVLQKRIHVSALASSSLLVILLALAFFPIASSYSSTLAAPAPSETTLSMTAESINLNLSVDNANGTFNASDPANLTVATNNYTGYTLSLLASSNDADATKLVNGENSISSISSVSSADDFNVGNWGIKPSKVNSAANNSYIPAPTAEGTTIDATNSANAEANSYTIALGAKADYSLPAGRYTNTFVITAVANPVGFTITYNKNTEDEVGSMPTNQAGSLEDTDITISANVPTRTGYTFNGWCNTTVTTTDGISSCAGTTYNPGDTFVTSMQTTNNLALTAMWNRTFTLNFDANEGTGTMPSQTITGNSANINENTFTRDGYDFTGWNTLANGTGTAYTSGAVYTVPATGTSETLYAQWEVAAVSFDKAFSDAGKAKAVAKDGNYYYQMQDMATAICNAVTTPTAADYSDTPEARLVDNRDKKVYWVAKLKDGRCWMTQNLDHDIVAQSNYYTPANTDITAPWTPVRATYKATSGTIEWSSEHQTPRSVDVGDWYWTDTWYTSVEYDYLANGENSQFKKSPFQGNGEHGHIGNYYNWSAAVAMNDTSSYTTSTYNNITANPQTSICPKGWRLPTIYNSDTDSRNEYVYLLNKYGAFVTNNESDRAIAAKPLYFTRSGFATPATPSSNAKIISSGYIGYYSSSTVYDDRFRYGLNMSSGSVVIYSFGNYKYRGSSIRCVAR